MRPGEVQRWRLLNSTDSDNFLLTLQGHGLNVIAMDGITVGRMYRLKPGDPLVMGPGQRIDVLVKAGAPGTYTLDTQDQESEGSVSPFRSAQYPDGIALSRRVSLHSADFPGPCSTVPNPAIEPPCPEGQPKPLSPFSYPITLATIQVDGPPVDMKLPTGALPVPAGLPSVETMLSLTPDAVRHVAFENCGNRPGTSQGPELRPSAQLPSCGWYFAKYGPGYWGDLPFNDLLMLRDADDVGQPNPGSETMPRISFKKEGLFDPTEPLFPDMIAGNYEEWTVINRSFTDHPFHIHQNHFLVTKINGIPLPRPEWHDTFLVPSAIAPNSPTGRPLGPYEPPYNQPVVNINDAEFGSITFRIYFNPVTVGCFVVHCHALNHEDIGMMQRLDILPAKGQPSGCMLDSDNAAVPIIDRLFAGRGKFQICRAAVRQSKPIPDGPSASASLSNPLADTAQ
jgi:FtsP/CotA-like multicopper oxidase with cupredoxin domain